MGRLKLKPLIGSVFNIGFLPNAPGTWGSLFALIPIYFIGVYLPIYSMLIFTFVCTLLTLWVAEDCEKEWGGDPSPLVMDEFAGQGMTFAWIPFFPQLDYNIILLMVGFFFFRVFDIKKPLGVDKLQNLSGGLGIVVDDLLAGVYAFICLKIILILINSFI
jgi:phosphatidylglycerophosphatase A